VRQYNFVGSILVNGRTTEVADRLAKETFRAADKVNRRPRQRGWSKRNGSGGLGESMEA
jgi:hypothetical protein